MDIIWEASAFIIDNSALLATACARRSSLELAWLLYCKKNQNWVNNIFIPCQKRKPNENSGYKLMLLHDLTKTCLIFKFKMVRSDI